MHALICIRFSSINDDCLPVVKCVARDVPSFVMKGHTGPSQGFPQSQGFLQSYPSVPPLHLLLLQHQTDNNHGVIRVCRHYKKEHVTVVLALVINSCII